MTGTLTPTPWFTGLDNNGNPISGGKLFTYQAGTTTKLASYQDSDLTTPHTNPIILDSAGRATIYLSPSSYKFVLAPANDTDPPTSAIRTTDPVPATPPFSVDVDVTGTAGEDLLTSQVVYLSAGDGSRTAGRWYLADADLAYASSTAKALGFSVSDLSTGVSGSIRLVGRVTGLSGLTAGTIYYASATAGSLTSTAPANARAICVADSTTSVILSQWVPPAPVTRALLVGIGDAGSGVVISTGVKAHLYIPFACTITGWTLISAGPVGSIVIDVWKDTYANSPPTVADTIAGTEKPTLSAVQQNQDTSLSSWTKTVSAGDVLSFNVDSASTVQQVTLVLTITI